jgi:DNA (cytosine-5)-methyltransferase 1
VTLGSLFDGSGTAPLAARMCGIEPIWCSEIEPFPIAVTRARFPDMKHYGNICTIKGDKIEPVDIICGGSPCQDLSVAGKRAGLEGGERSVLFHEQIRIIKEMRHATNDIRPRFAIWENVPGAFSSNKGEDFRCVLEAFCKIADETADIPRPAEGKWAAAGCIVGNGWSVAYRTLDAQYFGVPQRRRRIFLVADFGSECAAEILSEQGCLFGDIAESGETGESAAGKIEGGVGEAVGINGNTAGTLDGSYYKGVGMRSGIEREVVCQCEGGVGAAGFNGNAGAKAHDIGYEEGKAPCLRSGGVDHVIVSLTLRIRSGCDGGGSENIAVCRDIVRRLTPTECARLQRFPDGWCSNISIPNPTESDISFWQSVWDAYQSINGKKPKSVKQIVTWLKHPHSDSAEYKMWGNGMALPCVLYIMRGIISAERPII